MSDQDLLKIRVTADFKEAEGAFLRLSRTATTFEKDINRVSASLNREFNKIVGSAELFGDATNVVKDKMDALKNAMVSLLTMGFQPMNPEVQKLKAQYDKLAQSLGNTTEATAKTNKANNSAEASLKKTNQQWTNLALVVQDLPFGFRGIQNNLPALVGGMAGVTGGIYFAVSAVIALFTAWDMGAFGATKSTNDWAKAIKETNDEIRKSLNYTNGEVSNLQGLVDVMLDVNNTESIRQKALLEIKEAITKVDEAEGKKIKTIGDAILAVNLYTEAIQQQQMQEVIGKKIAEISIGQIEKRNKLAIETAKANRGFHPINAFMGNTELQGLESEILANETLIRQLEDLRTSNTKALLVNPFSKYNAKKPGAEKKPTLKQDDSLLKSLKAEEQLYKDDMFMKRAIGLEVINEEERLAVEKAKFEKASDKELLNIANEFKFKRLEIEKELKDGIQEINNVYSDERAKEQAKRDKEAFDAAKAAKNRELQNALDAIKIESDTRQKFHKKDRAQIDQDLKAEMDALMELAATGIYSAEQFDKITDAIIRVDAAIEGNKGHLKDFTIDWIDTLNNINGVIMDFINNSIFTLADSLGKVLGGETVDMVSAFGMLIADALQQIGKQLIAFATAWLFTFALMSDPNPISAAAALAAGIAAVAIGSLIKSGLNKKQQVNTPKFANGGIVSGPTYGLMGEYPGAKHNPEVVAPLDKLKSMIGGGGNGEFVLRGNDLVLALQRSNSSLTLRR